MSKLTYIEYNGVPVVSARELYALLTFSAGQNVSAWVLFCEKNSIMVEGADFYKVKTALGHYDILLVPSCALILCTYVSDGNLKEAYEALSALIKVEFTTDSDRDEGNTSCTSISIGHAAKILHYKGVGQKSLFEMLKTAKILMRSNVPYQHYIESGYFKVQASEYKSHEGVVMHSARTFVTVKGVEFLRKIIDKNKALIAA